MDNDGSGVDPEVSDMRLYLNADYPVDAAILYHADNRVVPVLLPSPYTCVEFDVDSMFGANVELDTADQGISRNVFQIVLDEEVSSANLSISGVNVRQLSADAFLAFPADVLGRDYVVLAYPNGFLSGDTYDTPSQFAVIGTEDGTEVSIAPSCPINDRASVESFTISLNAGEVYFAQAALGDDHDVSGAVIRASKPVAVFAGNKRASVPTDVGNFRDHLVEQMIPVERWGKSAVLPPFHEITPASQHKSIIRIVAAVDNTAWRLNGQQQQPLMAGEVREVAQETAVITASEPIQVATYEHSVGLFGATGPSELGDPFMMLVPSPEQYDTAYVFQSIGHEQFTRHFINIVVPTDVTSSVYLDEVSLQATYHPVPGTSYSYAQVPVQAGSHRIRAESSFGLMVYGYGPANSYGYIGGMRLPQRPAGVREDNAGLAGLSLRAVPQPVRDGSTAVELTLPRRMHLSLALFSLNGEKVADVFSQSVEQGVRRIPIDMSSLAAGVYLCRLTTETGETIVEEIVLER